MQSHSVFPVKLYRLLSASGFEPEFHSQKFHRSNCNTQYRYFTKKKTDKNGNSIKHHPEGQIKLSYWKYEVTVSCDSVCVSYYSTFIFICQEFFENFFKFFCYGAGTSVTVKVVISERTLSTGIPDSA